MKNMENEKLKSEKMTKIIVIIAKILSFIFIFFLSIIVAIETSGHYFNSSGNYVQREPNPGAAALITLLGYWLVKKVFNRNTKKENNMKKETLIDPKTKKISFRFNKIVKIGFIFLSIYIFYEFIFPTSIFDDMIVKVIAFIFCIAGTILINYIIKLNVQLEEANNKDSFYEIWKTNRTYTIVFSVINIFTSWVVLLMIPQYLFLSKTKWLMNSIEQQPTNTNDENETIIL